VPPPPSLADAVVLQGRTLEYMPQSGNPVVVVSTVGAESLVVEFDGCKAVGKVEIVVTHWMLVVAC
jgi:hypothetical protein